jgi:FAD/FMN-containing dehydrogenase
LIDRRPALVARCTGVADVVAAVDAAREHGLLVAVRGGGHSVAGFGVCDGGIVIDLSPMQGVRVDPVTRRARAQGGVTWGLLDREAQVFALATPGGVVSTTGIAGLTLGGGYGYLHRSLGMACDNLLAVDVVTAGGEVVTASETENPDLFFGLRGGGGNFGIATSFEYRLHPVGPLVLGGAVLHRFQDAAALLRLFRELLFSAPDELMVVAELATAPPAPFLPTDAHGKLVAVVAVCYAGDLEAGEQLLRRLRAFGRPLADLIGPMPYTALQSMLDERFAPGRLYYWKSTYLDDLADDAIETVLAHAEAMPSPLCSITMYSALAGEVTRSVGPDETAFGHRGHAIDFNPFAIWTDPGATDEHAAWIRDVWEAIEPFAPGAVYVNNLGDEGADRTRSAYRPETWERLVALKDRYDPTNLFRLNQNIPPSSASSMHTQG